MLKIIDALGPFFKDYNKSVYNWSKIPFENLEKDGNLDKIKCKKILKDLEFLFKKVKKLGYNAISLDDLAHLTKFDFYDSSFKRKIDDYKEFYDKIFKLAQKFSFKIFINTDVMFFNKFIHDTKTNHYDLFIQAIELSLSLPIDGIILRVGESDGVDVEGDFKSKLIIKTAEQLNSLISEVIHFFEENDKLLIVRTWTVGAFPIGDLIWNVDTYNKAFGNIKSENFVVSMKYGMSDFFRGLEINPLFFKSDHNKIVEFQAKREYDGFGELPYYVGWDYQEVWDAVKNENIVGISCWAQTGGWSSWKRLTFFDESWSELNTNAVSKVVDGVDNSRIINNANLEKFLKKYKDVSDSILFEKKVKNRFVRRVCIPPCCFVFWDHIIINPLISSYHSLYKNNYGFVSESDFEELASLGSCIENIEFVVDTLRIFLKTRDVVLGKRIDDKFMQDIETYRSKHNYAFSFSISTNNATILSKVLTKFLVRTSPKYRLRDGFLLDATVSSFIRKIAMHYAPSFLSNRSMSLNMLLR